MGLVPKALLRLQRAVIVKAMPLRQHGASALQCATIAAEIERRLPLLTAECDIQTPSMQLAVYLVSFFTRAC